MPPPPLVAALLNSGIESNMSSPNVREDTIGVKTT
jgi:hypothetical protein